MQGYIIIFKNVLLILYAILKFVTCNIVARNTYSRNNCI